MVFYDQQFFGRRKKSNLNINKSSQSFGSNLYSKRFVSSVTTDSDSILPNLNNFMTMFLIQFNHILLWKNVILIKFKILPEKLIMNFEIFFFSKSIFKIHKIDF